MISQTAFFCTWTGPRALVSFVYRSQKGAELIYLSNLQVERAIGTHHLRKSPGYWSQGSEVKQRGSASPWLLGCILPPDSPVDVSSVAQFLPMVHPSDSPGSYSISHPSIPKSENKVGSQTHPILGSLQRFAASVYCGTLRHSLGEARRVASGHPSA